MEQEGEAGAGARPAELAVTRLVLAVAPTATARGPGHAGDWNGPTGVAAGGHVKAAGQKGGDVPRPADEGCWSKPSFVGTVSAGPR